MRCRLAFGLQQAELDVPDERLVRLRRQTAAEPLADPAAAVREALECPHGFPALRRALTPDDHIAIFVEERLPRLPELLTPVLEHLRSAGIAPSAITLLCAPPSTGQPWAERLPEAFQEIHIEIHDPGERRKLSYLAATRQGRRIYLNRTAVDADQLILLTGRWFDTLLGVGGAEGALFPTLSDQTTAAQMAERFSLDAPIEAARPLQQEAREVAWLLGAPFLIQVIEGERDDIAHVIAGPVESSALGERLHEARWRVEAESRAELVVGGIGGDPDRHTFADLARGFLNASRVVAPGGSIVLLTDASPALGPGADLLRRVDDPGAALKLLHHEKPADFEAAFSWASAAQTAKLYLLSRLAAEVVEELFATPLEHAGQVHRLIAGAASCICLPDAHKTLAVVTPADERSESAG